MKPNVGTPNGDNADAETLPEGDSRHDEVSDFPETGSTRKRAAAAWWFLIIGPVFVAGSAIAASVWADERATQYTIVLAVFTVMWIIGLVASPKVQDHWWILPIVVAFVAAAAMVGLLSLAKVAVPIEDATTTSTTTTVPTTTAVVP